MATPPHGATRAGTEAFRQRMTKSGVVPEHYRDLDGVLASSLGIGTYLGSPTPQTDKDYTDSVVRAVELGTNFIDSAVNYRFQRSERSIGAALAHLLQAGTAARNELVLATKGGYIPFDGEAPADPAGWIRTAILEPGLARPGEVVAGCHCMTPRYLANQIELSRKNLGVETIDVYYVHNPETQLEEVERAEFDRRLRDAFVELERAAGAGRIRGYGLATWDGFRVEAGSAESLSLERVVALAGEAAGGGEHHFRAVQLPFNLAMHEATSLDNQTVGGKAVTLTEAARRLDVAVIGSASIFQARLSRGLPEHVSKAFPEARTDAQRALQFSRSAPGIASALVGMRKTAHVDENLELARMAPSPQGVADLFGAS